MSSMSDPTDVSQKQNDYKGKLLLAIVRENRDPKKFKRVKIEIPELIEGETDTLPWAIPITSDFDSVNVPDIGKIIYVELQNGDKHFPVYSGEFTGSDSPIPGVLQVNYPDRVGYSDRNGNHFFVDKSTNDVEFKHSSGTTFHIHSDGSITSNASTWTHTGNIVVNGDVIASGISLVHHRTTQVVQGGDLSGPPTS